MEPEKISNGTFVFRNAISDTDVDRILEIYHSAKSQGYLYRPRLANGKHMRLLMACFGWHWNPVDYKYYDNVKDVDGRPVLKYPEWLNDLLAPFNQQCFQSYQPNWDVLILNKYKEDGSLGLHSDNSESATSLILGHPIVSISLGRSCLFEIGGTHRINPTQTIELHHKDILLMGSVDRLNYHGVKRLTGVALGVPDELKDIRLNLTMRKI